MTEEKEKLSLSEQESITAAVLALVRSYPDFPKTIVSKNIHLDDLKDSVSIGIFPTAGAVITKKYISGSFEAQFPFFLLYKCNPTTDNAVIAARNVLDSLAFWLENTEYQGLVDGTEIQSIQRTTTAVLDGKTEDGASVFKCNCTLKYFKKRS